MAAWGTSLLQWLTGQFSAVLRRAERCRTELRGSTPASEPGAGAGVGGAAPGVSEASSVAAAYGPGGGDAVGSGSPTDASSRGSGGLRSAADRGLVPASPERPSALVSAGGRGAHGAAPATVAVSAKDIVVRSALAMAKESAASEVLGMWEPARKGYEKVRYDAEWVGNDGERLVRRRFSFSCKLLAFVVGSSSPSLCFFSVALWMIIFWLGQGRPPLMPAPALAWQRG